MKKIIGMIILSIAISSAAYAADDSPVDKIESTEEPIILETQLNITEPAEGSVQENVIQEEVKENEEPTLRERLKEVYHLEIEDTNAIHPLFKDVNNNEI